MQPVPEWLSEDMAVAVAGALDAQDLAERLSTALSCPETRVPVRIWSVEVGGRPLVLSQSATRGRAPAGGLETVRAVLSHDGPVRSGSALLGALRKEGTPFGVLETESSDELASESFPVL